MADRRAATPSQAAELANFVFDDFAQGLVRFSDKLDRALDYKLQSATQKLENYKLRLNAMRPENKIKANEEHIRALYLQINSLMKTKLERYENKLIAFSGQLDGLSPAKKLATGFGYITDVNDLRIDSISQLQIGDSITLRIKDGTIKSQVTDIDSN